MKLYEFTTENGYNDRKRSDIFFEEALIKRSRKLPGFLYEDQEDVKDYRNFIREEKQYTIPYSDLIIGQSYFPISYRGAPFQQTIYMDIPPNDCEFTSADSAELCFKIDNDPYRFRISKPNATGTLDTLIFKDKDEAKQHMLTLKLRFNDWYMPTTIKSPQN